MKDGYGTTYKIIINDIKNVDISNPYNGNAFVDLDKLHDYFKTIDTKHVNLPVNVPVIHQVTYSITPLAKPPPAKPSSAKPSPAKPSSAKPSSAKPSSAKPSSTKPSSAKPPPAKIKVITYNVLESKLCGYSTFDNIKVNMLHFDYF